MTDRKSRKSPSGVTSNNPRRPRKKDFETDEAYKNAFALWDESRMMERQEHENIRNMTLDRIFEVFGDQRIPSTLSRTIGVDGLLRMRLMVGMSLGSGSRYEVLRRVMDILSAESPPENHQWNLVPTVRVEDYGKLVVEIAIDLWENDDEGFDDESF